MINHNTIFCNDLLLVNEDVVIDSKQKNMLFVCKHVYNRSVT